ncbi:MAG: 3-oxoacyl-[acyl-carrier-protein] synthase III C-terminal domain-containing protein [Paracoccus sp. (in: a-proteobacteria)]|nr:3-oxoacyl-[acyl-carrier-protein] synthase III C-terminal domain-containing protein [Paracoccus sp. (in: a-proteobacteria)]
METWSEGRDACVLAAGGTRVNPASDGGIPAGDALFRMDGQAAFRVAAKRLPRFLARLLASAGVTREDIDVVIPHQASAQALDHARALVGFGKAQLVDIFADHGNQIASSIPTALHHAASTGRMVPGRLALLIGTSAGISIGGALIRC